MKRQFTEWENVIDTLIWEDEGITLLHGNLYDASGEPKCFNRYTIIWDTDLTKVNFEEVVVVHVEKLNVMVICYTEEGTIKARLNVDSVTLMYHSGKIDALTDLLMGECGYSSTDLKVETDIVLFKYAISRDDIYEETGLVINEVPNYIVGFDVAKFEFISMYEYIEVLEDLMARELTEEGDY